VPIDLKLKKETVQFKVDESPRPDSTPQSVGKLKPVFKENGVTTAANSSGISDGAASIIIASGEAVEQYNLKPLARVVSYHVSGVKPEIMGIGKV
jgi:acetyl-CoA acetyltransferase